MKLDSANETNLAEDVAFGDPLWLDSSTPTDKLRLNQQGAALTGTTMRIAVWKSTSRWLFTVITATLVIADIPSARAQSGTRSFQMSLWSDKSLTGATLDGDIRSFSFSNENQPPEGPTIMVGYAPAYDLNYPGFTIEKHRATVI